VLTTGEIFLFCQAQYVRPVGRARGDQAFSVAFAAGHGSVISPSSFAATISDQIWSVAHSQRVLFFPASRPYN